MAEVIAYIGLGSNIGDRKANIDKALKMLGEIEGIKVVRVSDIIETAPLGQADQPMYLNAVAKLKTSLGAKELLDKLMTTETALGRKRKKKWAPRTIDLDLLLFGDETIDSLDLTVPHPQMHVRSFILKELCQLDSGLFHPAMKEWLGELAARLNDCDFTLDIERPQLISIAGVIGVGKTTLMNRLAERFGCDMLREPYDMNPYMKEVYAGKKELALDSQLFFLTARLRQLDPNKLAKGRIYISDYVFDKELIYAKRLLNKQQLSVYEDIYPSIAVKVLEPVLVIYLRDSADNCLNRIHERNRSYEQQIKLKFLKDLRTDYERLFADWKKCPVIRISVPEFNCKRDEDIEYLRRKVKFYTITK
jgi:deoxyguanosine kinase